MPITNRLIANFLSQCRTTFQLGDYRSQPKQLTIGLPKGSLLSVILYILYNSSLLQQVNGTKTSIAMGFIDNVAFLTARKTPTEVTATLQSLADKKLRWGKKHGAAFDRKKSQWMLLTHRKTNHNELVIQLGDVSVKPQPSVKWLGVTIEPKLTFTSHIQNQATKA